MNLSIANNKENKLILFIFTILFVTGLAPLSERYGIIAGLLAGFVNLLITPFALSFQGGFDLYNNGFVAA